MSQALDLCCDRRFCLLPSFNLVIAEEMGPLKCHWVISVSVVYFYCDPPRPEDVLADRINPQSSTEAMPIARH